MNEKRQLPKGLNAVVLNLELDPEVTPEIIHEFTEELMALSKRKRLARETLEREKRPPRIIVD